MMNSIPAGDSLPFRRRLRVAGISRCRSRSSGVSAKSSRQHNSAVADRHMGGIARVVKNTILNHTRRGRGRPLALSITRVNTDFVRHQTVGLQPFGQGLGLCAVSGCSARDNHFDRQSMAINGRMQPGVQPALGPCKTLVPPFAPAAWGWALTWLASIISHLRSGSFDTIVRSLCQIPGFRHRKNRLETDFRLPYSTGKSRHGVPVHNFHTKSVQKQTIIISPAAAVTF